MKILYHVSMRDNKEIKNKIFIPRVPESCADFESKSIKRICFSTSIEKCIIASGILSLLKPDIILNVFTLYVDDNDKYLKDPNYVYSVGNVKDALGNEEYWYTKPVKLYCDNYKILQIDYEPEIDWKCISIEEIKYALKTIFDYNDIIHKKFIDIIIILLKNIIMKLHIIYHTINIIMNTMNCIITYVKNIDGANHIK